MAKALTTGSFIAKAIAVHEDKYDYSKVVYVNAKTKVTIIDKNYGEFQQIPSSHLSGSGHPKGKGDKISKSRSSTKEDFLQKAKALHKDSYDYSKVDYKGDRVKVDILCKSCNVVFSQIPNSHLQGKGCKQCGHTKSSKKLRNTEHDIINRCVEVHGNRYNYSKLKYTITNEHVTIICNKCNLEFKQTPHNHLAGNGCPDCSDEHKGWTYTKWERRGNSSIHFDSFKLYVIKCYNDTEEFYKVGKTFNTIDTRFSGSKLPYKYEIIHIRTGTARYISQLEHRVHRLLRSSKYRPVIPFKGNTECFN